MLTRICTLALRHRRAVAVALLALVPLLAVAGHGVADRLSVGGFTDPGAESSRGEAVLEETFGAGSPDLVLLVEAREGRVEEPANAGAGVRLTAIVEADPGVSDAVSFWDAGRFVPNLQNPLRSLDGRRAVIGVSLAGDAGEQRETAQRVAARAGELPQFDVRVGGAVEVARVAAERAERDLKLAELIVAPLTLGALFLVFRGWRAAVLPLAVALLTVLGTFVVLSALAARVEISTFALNLTTALGLGLSIDYALLIVARYREELAVGRADDLALQRTMQTAGRTVLFSGATVATSMLALLVFPVAYLRSFALAGVAVVATACAATMVVAPVMLAAWGRRIGSSATASSATGGFWTAQTRRVVARPWPWLVAVVGVLVMLGLPFLQVVPGRVDDRVLPAGAEAREVADALRSGFDGPSIDPVAVVAPEIEPTAVDRIAAIESTLLEVDGVARFDSVLGTATPDGRRSPTALNRRFAAPGSTWFEVTLTDPPESGEAGDTVRAVRDALPDDVLVTGTVAARLDAVDGVTSRLPAALAVIVAVTVALLFMMTGSLLVPLKAIVLNLFSLTATFGALVWIFQDGHLGSVLGVTATGSIDVFTPILMFCIAFGLSMDYEVFLLSRIKEEYDLTGDDRAAVVAGIGHTGRLVTAAAVMLALVFMAISTSGITVVKMFGVGLTIAVLTDAFAVRATLMPALMALAGPVNWWAPRPLRLFHLRWGLWEHEPILLPAPDHPEETRHDDLDHASPAGRPAGGHGPAQPLHAR